MKAKAILGAFVSFVVVLVVVMGIVLVVGYLLLGDDFLSAYSDRMPQCSAMPDHRYIKDGQLNKCWCSETAQIPYSGGFYTKCVGWDYKYYYFSQGYSAYCGYCPEDTQSRKCTTKEFKECAETCPETGQCLRYDYEYKLVCEWVDGCVTYEDYPLGEDPGGRQKVHEYYEADTVQNSLYYRAGGEGIRLGSHYIDAKGKTHQTNYCIMSSGKLMVCDASTKGWVGAGSCNCNQDSDCKAGQVCKTSCTKAEKQEGCVPFNCFGDVTEVPAPPDAGSFLNSLWDSVRSWINGLFGVSVLASVPESYEVGDPVSKTLTVATGKTIDEDYSDGTVSYIYYRWGIYREPNVEVDSSGWIKASSPTVSHTFNYQPSQSGKYAFTLVVAEAVSVYGDTGWTPYSPAVIGKTSEVFTVTSDDVPSPGPVNTDIFSGLWNWFVDLINSIF